MSVIHPGSSINFDGTDLQQTEEDEIQREDIKQQQELHELLSAELPDDLLDDSCNGSLNSPANQESNQQIYGYSRESSNTDSWHSESTGNGSGLQHHISQSGDGTSNYQNNKSPVQNGFSHDQAHQFMNSYGKSYTDAEKWQMQQQFHRNYIRHQPPVRDRGVGDYGYYHDTGLIPATGSHEVHGFAERREAEGSEDFDATTHDNNYHFDTKLSTTLPSIASPTIHASTNGKSVRFEAFSAPTSPYSNQYGVPFKPLDGYQYRTTGEPFESKANDSVGSDYVDAPERSVVDETSASKEVTQLRILYEARGKKIDKLTREIESMQQDTNREKRILTHQLAMAKDHKDGMSASLEECQRLLMEKDRKISEEKGKNSTFQMELESQKSTKAELMKKVELCEQTIENLQQEVVMLQQSDALERVRQQHEAVLAAANERHERQVLEVSTMLDEVRRVADEKTEEAEQLRIRLKAALKESEDVLFDKTETINRLSRNLEDSQNHCQELLAGSGENAFLQKHVSELSKQKAALDRKNVILENTIAELGKNLSMYESAFQLGVASRPLNSDGMSDSYSELLGPKKILDWKNPKNPAKSKNELEDLVESLRLELERALVNNKEKRDQVAGLHKQIQDLNEESSHWRKRVDEAEQQTARKTCGSPLRRENVSDLDEQLEESLERATSAEERAMRLEETCRDLKQQMSELVQQHDTNKQEAVDRCERACMLLHEDSKQAIREELLAEHEQKLYELSIEHEGQLQELKDRLGGINSELSEVKQSYVHICSEKDSLEAKLNLQYEKEKQELMENFEKEKADIKAGLEKELDSLKKQGEEESEKRSEEYVSTKIALAKATWMDEHVTQREEALREFAKNKEDEFEKRVEALRNDLKLETDKEINRALEEKRVTWEEEKEKEIQSRLNILYEELNDEKKTAVSAATSIAQLNWITEQQNSAEAEFHTRLDEARRMWNEEHQRLIDTKVTEAMQKMQNKIEALNEERDSLVTQELKRAEREWKRKREESLRRKDDEMQEQLRRLEEKHEKEYEEFTKQHKLSLENFLKNERSTTSSREREKDAMDEMRKQWSMERDHLQRSHQRELKRLHAVYEARCQDYRNEIKALTSSYDSTQNRVTGEEVEEKIAAIEKKNKEEIERLKNRMKDEYRRWKREREELRTKLEEAKGASPKIESASGGMDPNVFVNLRESYVGTLGSIKGEMLSFIRESRTRSLVALKTEAQREKERIFEKLRHRRRFKEDTIFPSFLAEKHCAVEVERAPVLLRKSSNLTENRLGKSSKAHLKRPVSFQGSEKET